MANHTPGPWEWTEYSINGDGKNKTTVLCGVGYFPHVLISDEDKSLIAAAPDMHDALALGGAMRAAQNRYFKNRSQENLIASKAAEAAFDKAAKGALDNADGATQQGVLL